MLTKRPLGKTGFEVALLGLGGQSTLQDPDRPEDAEAIVNRALDLGINYIDTSPRYGDTTSEKHLGRIMASRRSEVFLATKTADRTYDGTMRQVEDSLKRLQTDHLDLYQIHNLRLEDELLAILGKDGALKAFEKLKDDGVIRFMGVTGHKDPALMLDAIRAFPFDTVLMSLNVGDIHDRSFKEQLLGEAVKREMGIIAMKLTANGRLKPGEMFTIKEMLEYVFTLPVSNAIVGISSLAELEENVKIAGSFTPLSNKEMTALEDKAKPLAYPANYFKHEW